MKKRLWSLLLVAVMLTSLLPLSGMAAVGACPYCAEAGLSAQIVMKSDANGHWEECETADCWKTAPEAHSAGAAATWVQISGEENHEAQCAVCTEMLKEACVDGDRDQACDVCGGAMAHTHVWSYVSTTGETLLNYVCECGQTMTEHKHKWSDAENLHFDHTGHWRECTADCPIVNKSEKEGWGVHIDANGNGICEYCWYEMDASSTVYKQLVISSLDRPTVGKKVDFDISLAPMEFDNATITWNRVVNLAQNTSVAMNKENVYAAGKMYNVGITLRVSKHATFADDFTVTLSGEPVTLYKSKAEFDKAASLYNGTKDVSMAYVYVDANGFKNITVCKMYAKLAGECAHDITDETVFLYNTTHHYQQCTMCGDMKHYVKHFDFNKNGTCDRCGYNPNAVSSTGGSHKHSWSTDWVEDISNHWHQCNTCGAKKDTGAHADPNNNGKCDTCGFVMTAAAGHTHSFATTWTETAYQHWHQCSCGAKNDIGAHVDKNKSGLCDDCGYTMTAALNAAANGTVANVGGTGGTGNVLGGNVIPNTGDSTDMTVVYLWMAALAASVLGLGGTALAWRKRKES